MTTLHFYNNKITSLESGDFDGLASLTYLSVTKNPITSLESGDFDGTGQLDDIGICATTKSRASNRASSPGLGNVTILDLYGNQITSIESGDFDGLASLTELDLYNNKITSLKSGGFAGLGNVTELDLCYNQITSIESGAFAGLSNLTTLYLYDNKITSLESGAFAGLGNLTTLYLGYNDFLKDLNLEDADFSSLTAFDVTSYTSIARVSLRNTRLNQTALAALVDGGDPDSGYTGIGDLPGVTELDLGGIDFSAITDPLTSVRDGPLDRSLARRCPQHGRQCAGCPSG